VKSEPDSQPAADERENKKPAPAIDFGDPPAAIELAKQPIANDKERVDAKPTPSPTGSERKPPGGESPQTASPTFKFTDAATVRDAADKAKGKQFEVTLVSGLTKTDEVQVTVGSGGEAVGCELIKKQRTVHPQWELKERNGNKKLLAKFECKGNELKLDIEDSPKSESLRYVAFIVEVSPAGNSTAKREFCLAEPSKERFSLTPVKRKTSSDVGAQNLTEYSHDEKFRLFVDENASKRLMSLMKENPHLGLKLACDKNRIIANLQNQDDKVSVLYIQPVQVKATTRTTAAEAQCGIVLEKSTDPDLVFRLTKYSFPKPHPNIGGSEPLEWPPRPVHKEEAVKSLKDKLTNATEACTEKENKCGDSKLTTDQKTQCEQQLTNLKQVKQDAQNNYDAGKINFEESFTFVNSITLEDFQDVPVLVTLCDNNSNDKIVIIDSLSLATSQK
jgi:hypothetical protein